MIGDIDPGVLLELAISHHVADLRRAEADRVAKRHRRRGPSLRTRATEALGDGLIGLGLRLKRRHARLSETGHLYEPSAP